jgi:UDP-2,4-diacetamido-2,4,6-trideoxy-beta-L-altropyranose hydrolase
MRNEHQKPHVLFRADASKELGVGHVMRCLALADALNDRCWKVIFASRNLQDHLAQTVQKTGELLPIPDQISMRSEPDYILGQLSGSVDLLVTDNYEIDMQWHTACRRFTKSIIAIDDLVNRQLDCDVLQNQNPGSSTSAYDGLVPESCNRLVGPSYALLRPQFAHARENMVVREHGINRVLITMGGTDPFQQTAKVLKATGLLGEVDLHLDVVISSDSPDLDDLQKMVGCLPHTVTLHQSVQDMAALMLRADLAIGTSGVTALERCALHLPSVLIVVAENQQVSADALAASGAAINLGWYEEVTAEQIAAAVNELMHDREKLGSMQMCAGQLVDGNGVQRVVEAVSQLNDGACNLKLRLVTRDEASLLFEWANDQVVRDNSFHPSPISWETHVAWLDSRLADGSCLFLMAEQNGMPVGHVRFEISSNIAEISITVSPLMRGRGVGQYMLQQALIRLAEIKSDVNIIAHIKKGNGASQRLFEKCGFINNTAEHAAHLTYIYNRTAANSECRH